MVTVMRETDKIGNFITLGRRGLFNYNNIDHCMDMGFKAAEHVNVQGSLEAWKLARAGFSNYVIID
ncbi:hypothetical protein HZC09_01255 [Candidatus Micrarchaeota archaeon]|nr:hypothetical protein [Candidatus Micrarchaeota archaeon]